MATFLDFITSEPIFIDLFNNQTNQSLDKTWLCQIEGY
jgi:hypothetical protein